MSPYVIPRSTCVLLKLRIPLKVSLGELALDFSLDVPLGMDFEKLTLSVRSTTPGGQADKLGVFKGFVLYTRI